MQDIIDRLEQCKADFVAANKLALNVSSNPSAIDDFIIATMIRNVFDAAGNKVKDANGNDLQIKPQCFLSFVTFVDTIDELDIKKLTAISGERIQELRSLYRDCVKQICELFKHLNTKLRYSSGTVRYSRTTLAHLTNLIKSLNRSYPNFIVFLTQAYLKIGDKVQAATIAKDKLPQSKKLLKTGYMNIKKLLEKYTPGSSKRSKASSAVTSASAVTGAAEAEPKNNLLEMQVDFVARFLTEYNKNADAKGDRNLIGYSDFCNPFIIQLPNLTILYSLNTVLSSDVKAYIENNYTDPNDLRRKDYEIFITMYNEGVKAFIQAIDEIYYTCTVYQESKEFSLKCASLMGTVLWEKASGENVMCAAGHLQKLRSFYPHMLKAREIFVENKLNLVAELFISEAGFRKDLHLLYDFCDLLNAYYALLHACDNYYTFCDGCENEQERFTQLAHALRQASQNMYENICTSNSKHQEPHEFISKFYTNYDNHKMCSNLFTSRIMLKDWVDQDALTVFLTLKQIFGFSVLFRSKSINTGKMTTEFSDKYSYMVTKAISSGVREAQTNEDFACMESYQSLVRENSLSPEQLKLAKQQMTSSLILNIIKVSDMKEEDKGVLYNKISIYLEIFVCITAHKIQYSLDYMSATAIQNVYRVLGGLFLQNKLFNVLPDEPSLHGKLPLDYAMDIMMNNNSEGARYLIDLILTKLLNSGVNFKTISAAYVDEHKENIHLFVNLITPAPTLTPAPAPTIGTGTGATSAVKTTKSKLTPCKWGAL